MGQPPRTRRILAAIASLAFAGGEAHLVPRLEMFSAVQAKVASACAGPSSSGSSRRAGRSPTARAIPLPRPGRRPASSRFPLRRRAIPPPPPATCGGPSTVAPSPPADASRSAGRPGPPRAKPCIVRTTTPYTLTPSRRNPSRPWALKRSGVRRPPAGPGPWRPGGARGAADRSEDAARIASPRLRTPSGLLQARAT